MQGDLVLLRGDVGPGGGRVAVGVGDRFALKGDLLVRDRDAEGLLLGDHVLAQPGGAGLDGLRVGVQFFLGAGHRLVGGRTRGVAPGDPGLPGPVPTGVLARLRVRRLAGGRVAIGCHRRVSFRMRGAGACVSGWVRGAWPSVDQGVR